MKNKADGLHLKPQEEKGLGGIWMIRNVVFDMGNVLIHFKPERFIKRMGITDQQAGQLLIREVFGSVAWSLMDWGVMDEAACEREVLPRLPEALRAPARQLIHRWDQPIMPMEGMAAFVRRCKEAGLGIYLLSNASGRLHDYWPDIPGSPLFDGVVVSADHRCVKPMPQIFDYLLNRFGLAAPECLFIDDMPINVAGAMTVGMQGFLFRENVAELERRVFG